MTLQNVYRNTETRNGKVIPTRNNVIHLYHYSGYKMEGAFCTSKENDNHPLCDVFLGLETFFFSTDRKTI